MTQPPTDRFNEEKSAFTVRGSDQPDVILDVPNLSVEQITLNGRDASPTSVEPREFAKKCAVK